MTQQISKARSPGAPEGAVFPFYVCVCTFMHKNLAKKLECSPCLLYLFAVIPKKLHMQFSAKWKCPSRFNEVLSALTSIDLTSIENRVL